MLPGHEIDRNLPLRKFFLALANRAIELSRSDLPMRRALEAFGKDTGFDFKDSSFEAMASDIMFKSEVSKDVAYGVLDLQHFTEFVEYLAFNAEEAKKKGLTGQFQEKLEGAYRALDNLSRYADGIALETFDYHHVHTAPFGKDPSAH